MKVEVKDLMFGFVSLEKEKWNFLFPFSISTFGFDTCN